LALIRAQDKKDYKIKALLESIKTYLQGLSLEVLGPAPAPLARKANLYRMQLLIKSSARKPLQLALASLRDWLHKNKQGVNVRWNVDVDPQDLS
jgi:primosomal protein N' (replication factor Y)